MPQASKCRINFKLLEFQHSVHNLLDVSVEMEKDSLERLEATER